jgi:hypothetical protein
LTSDFHVGDFSNFVNGGAAEDPPAIDPHPFALAGFDAK